jgi:peroxiredoxin
MMHIDSLLVLALWLQSQPSTVAVRAGCAEDADQLTVVQESDGVEVIQALAGAGETCYKVALTRPGQSLAGYVLGEKLPAIAAYIEKRRKVSEADLDAFARQAVVRPAPATAAAAAPDPSQPPAELETFENFSGRSINGKTVSLAGLRGKVILVTFWSPKNGASKDQLTSLVPLYHQFKQRGLAVIGVSIDPNLNHMMEALDDLTLGWPQVADSSGLAKRYRVDPRGKTFVLDTSRHIVASGLSGAELERKVRELLQ